MSSRLAKQARIQLLALSPSCLSGDHMMAMARAQHPRKPDKSSPRTSSWSFSDCMLLYHPLTWRGDSAGTTIPATSRKMIFPKAFCCCCISKWIYKLIANVSHAALQSPVSHMNASVNLSCALQSKWSPLHVIQSLCVSAESHLSRQQSPWQSRVYGWRTVEYSMHPSCLTLLLCMKILIQSSWSNSYSRYCPSMCLQVLK